MATLHGGCHCGNLRVALDTALDASALPLRACQCSFCLRHASITTSDPSGRILVEVQRLADLQRYRFGHGITDFLICRVCGVYVAAMMVAGGQSLGVLNANVLADRGPLARPATPVHYGAESTESRELRRTKAWMPIVVSEVGR